MSQMNYAGFKEALKKCLKECNEAVMECLALYNKAEDGIKSMNKEEEKAFLKSALLDLYKEADNKFEFQPLIDAGVETIAIPYGVDVLFDKFSK